MAMDSSSILRKRTSPRHDIGPSFEGRGYTSDEVASPPKYNFRQNAESVGLDPGANTVHLICRPPDTTAIPT